MRELRRDPVVDRWVIISAERAARPMTTSAAPAPEEESFCAFCEGAESSTPEEVLAFREEGSSPNGPGWRLRVVPNKFPALAREGDLTVSREGMFDRMSGIGVHEVLIETPDHGQTLASLPPRGIADLFHAVRLRFIELKKDKRIRCAQFFKNHGHAAGASIEHTHSQIIAMPVVSKPLKEEFDGANRYFEKRKSCVYCDIISQEIASGTRVVLETERFVAFAPYASRFAYETWVLPKSHCRRYEEADDDSIDALAEIFKEALRKTNSVLDFPTYNLMLHTSSFDSGHYDHYHWHMEFMPVVSRVAGFEWVAGFFINPVPPEDAARRLREA